MPPGKRETAGGSERKEASEASRKRRVRNRRRAGDTGSCAERQRCGNSAAARVDGIDKEGTVADVWIRYVDVPNSVSQCEIYRYRPYLVQQ